MVDFLNVSFARQMFKNIYGSSFITTVMVIFLAILLLILKFTRKKYRYPPGLTRFSLLTYLPIFGPEPFKYFDRLKEKYGNVFSLYMGPLYIVVIGDYEGMKEAYSKPAMLNKRSKLFDSLPDAMGFSSNNGEEWVEQRRFCVKAMKDLGIGKSKWESMIQAQVEDFVNLVSFYKGQPVDIFEQLTSSVSNNITFLLFGRRLPNHHPDRKRLNSAMEAAMKSFDPLSLYNFFPILRDVSVALGIGKAAKTHENLVNINNFVRKEVEKMKLCYKNGEQENFIVHYLKMMDSCRDRPVHGFTDRNLHGNLQTLFISGSDTIRNSIHWLLLIMAEHQDIQDKVQKEIDSVLGKDGPVQWSQRKELPFLNAVIMEGQRWRTLVPISSGSNPAEDIKIQGYDLLKGTTTFISIWGVHNDKRYWKDPEKFYPERFLTEDGKDVKTKLESYKPFSFGKRNCPGETIAMISIFLYFTALMQRFRVMPPKDKKIKLSGKMGLTYQAQKQDLIFVPRE